MNTPNTIVSSYHSKVSSTQNMRVPSYFSLAWVMEFNIVSPCLGKVFSGSSNLTNLVDLQSLHENGKLIMGVPDEVYTLFKKTFLLV